MTYMFILGRGTINGLWLFVICVSLVICVIPVRKGYAAAKGIYPLMDDTWYKVLNLVKEKTPRIRLLIPGGISETGLRWFPAGGSYLTVRAGIPRKPTGWLRLCFRPMRRSQPLY